MEYNKLSKLDLVALATKLEQEKNNALAIAEHNAKVANWFQAVLEALEKILISSPFVNQEGKFFKKLFWVLSNFAAIRTFIEDIATQLKLWRDDVNKLKAQAEANKVKTEE